jgi:hypothetical protein
MSKFADKQFWIDTMDRTLSSFAQGILGSAALETVGVIDVDWVQVLSLGGSYALLSLLTSVAFRGSDKHPTATI